MTTTIRESAYTPNSVASRCRKARAPAKTHRLAPEQGDDLGRLPPPRAASLELGAPGDDRSSASRLVNGHPAPLAGCFRATVECLVSPTMSSKSGSEAPDSPVTKTTRQWRWMPI